MAAPGSAVTYYDVTLSGFTNAAVSSATWKFSVANSALSTLGLAAANVRLYHFGTQWDVLPTQVTSADATNTNFSATVTSFSPFAVAGTTGLAATGSSYVLIGFVVLATLIAIGAALRFNRSRS